MGLFHYPAEAREWKTHLLTSVCILTYFRGQSLTAICSGKILGGSSAINFLVLPRASKPEYDSWASFGNPGWDWDGLVPYFQKAETFKPATPDQIIPGVKVAQHAEAEANDQRFHGTTGAIQVRKIPYCNIYLLTFDA